MHKDRNEDRWSALRGKTKQRWDQLNHGPSKTLTVRENDLNMEGYDPQKIRKARADKHLRDLEKMLERMSSYGNQNSQQS